MSIVLALLAFGVSTCIAASVVGRGLVARMGRGIATVGALGSGLLVPPEHVFLRFLLAVAGFGLLMRIVDLRGDRRSWSFGARLWLCSALVDVREAGAATPRLDPRRLLAVVAHSGLAAVGWWLSHGAVEHVSGPGTWLLRYGGGVTLIYGVADAACGAVVVAYAALGVRIPLQHRAPILATSVGRFWSRHYNLNVSAWLGRHFHRPAAKRGRARAGLIAAFGASTLVHIWVAWVPLDAAMALSMGGFFVISGAIVVVERSWQGFARLPTLARRAWTVGWLLLSSPLFVEPFLRILEGVPR